jgi:hypothetical protein
MATETGIEIERRFLLKKARRVTPQDENIYENIKFVMTNQIRLYNALNKELV